MAKSPKKETVNLTLLRAIVSATESGNFYRVTQAEGVPLMNHVPPLIEVDTTNVENDKAAAKATAEGIKMVKGDTQTIGKSDIGTISAAALLGNQFALMSGVELPASKRGQGLHPGREEKYPFAKMEVGQSFFVPVSETMPDPLKTMGSTVASVNKRYSEETGEMHTVTRAKRDGRKAAVDEQGHKIKETVTIPKRKFTRKYVIRSVTKGVNLGSWTPDSDGVIIARTE